MSRPKPRLVTPAEPRKLPSTPLYEQGLALGAIAVRREDADRARRAACDAFNRGDIGEAFRLHLEADQHLAEVERQTKRIGSIGEMG